MEDQKNRDNFPDVPEEELILRRLLWLHHGCPSEFLYGDDGELQCSNHKHGMKGVLFPSEAPDFRRDPAALLEWKLMNEEAKKFIPCPKY